MKLHQDASGALNTVTGYGPDYVDVNLERHETSVIVLPGAPGSTMTLVSWRSRLTST
nr:hypothetical protein [Burkholderia cenocepacia]